MGHDEWLTKAELASLPTKYNAKYLVECINFDDQPLHYEGVENIDDLQECKSISLRNTRHFNDWCLDRLCGNYLPKLEELDITGTDTTERGLEAIYRLPALKRLILDKSSRDTVEYKLIFAMLEEMNLDLHVLDSSEAKQDFVKNKV